MFSVKGAQLTLPGDVIDCTPRLRPKITQCVFLPNPSETVDWLGDQSLCLIVIHPSQESVSKSFNVDLQLQAAAPGHMSHPGRI